MPLANYKIPAKQLCTAACFALLCAVVTAPAARGEFFTFSTLVAPTNTVTAGGVNISLIPASVNTPGDNLDASPPSGTDIVFGYISVTGLTLASKLEAINIPYNFQVSVSNYAEGFDNVPTGPPVVFNIAGTLSGTVGAGKKVNITNSFTLSSIVQNVGGEPYEFSSFGYLAPGIANQGAFGAHVEVVPEPTTLTLLALGAIGLATPAYRRWRRTSPRQSG